MDLSAVPLDEDGAIARVFAQSADFCADLARAIEPKPAPGQLQTDDRNGPEHGNPAGIRMTTKSA